VIVVGIVTPSTSSASALAIARRCAVKAPTELAGSVPADPSGDRLLIDLAASGIGHATIQRTSAEPEPADVDLALRYLPDVRVIILAGGGRPLVEAAAAAASWSGAELVLVERGPTPDGLPVEPLVLAPPARDPDETFAGFVAELAVRIDGGIDVSQAFSETVAMLGADRVSRGDRVDRAVPATAPD
jgi:hypothetical protein